jgi:LacI family transcriptional regulator
MKKHKKRVKKIDADLYWDGGYEAMKKYSSKNSINKSKVNVFATCDMLGFGVRNFFNEKNLLPNKNYNLIGVDDIPISKVIGLTTIHQPLELMADNAVGIFKKFLENKEKKITHKKIESKLIVRET